MVLWSDVRLGKLMKFNYCLNFKLNKYIIVFG